MEGKKVKNGQRDVDEDKNTEERNVKEFGYESN